MRYAGDTITGTMAHINVHLRWLFLFLLFFCMIWISACGRTEANSHRTEQDEISLDQKVTVKGKPQDLVFKDFEKNWRKFISNAPQFTLPVLPPKQPPPAAPEPIITSECVYSADANGYVPQVTISWNEPATAPIELRSRKQTQNQSEVPSRRLDLGLNFNPFARNFYSSILSTDKNQRFSLPSNSALISNPETVLLTGPGLFPKLMDFRTQSLQDPSSHRNFDKQTAVLRDLNEGISYTMRVSRLSGQNWNADRQIVFMAPVCPNSF